MTMSTRPDLSPITSPDDPRLTGMGQEDVAGADQIVRLLAVSPREETLQASLKLIVIVRATSTGFLSGPRTGS